VGRWDYCSKNDVDNVPRRKYWGYEWLIVTNDQSHVPLKPFTICKNGEGAFCEDVERIGTCSKPNDSLFHLFKESTRVSLFLMMRGVCSFSRPFTSGQTGGSSFKIFGVGRKRTCHKDESCNVPRRKYMGVRRSPGYERV
jgi:hypothetical protein